MISIVNESDFNIDSGLCVIKFWAAWCGPCKKMVPTMDQLESEFPLMKFLSVDVDQTPTLAQKYRVRMLPTIILAKDGLEINRITGLSLIEPLRKLFREEQKKLDSVI